MCRLVTSNENEVDVSAIGSKLQALNLALERAGDSRYAGWIDDAQKENAFSVLEGGVGYGFPVR